MDEQFTIWWDGTQYRVSVPDYSGATVVPAHEYDRLKTERDAYRALAGIGLNGTNEADELARLTPPWERDAEAFRRIQERGLASMKAAADAARAAFSAGTDGNGS